MPVLERPSRGTASRLIARSPQCASETPERKSTFSIPVRIGLPIQRCDHGIAPFMIVPFIRDPITRSAPLRSRSQERVERAEVVRVVRVGEHEVAARAPPRGPARYALPYPRRGSVTTRAPAALASAAESSSDALSTTTTSPSTPSSSSFANAFCTTVAIDSASLRHGITNETSGASAAVLTTGEDIPAPRVRASPHRWN